MKKLYVSFLLNTVTFDEEDVIRTSGVATQASGADVDVSWASIFGVTEEA